MIDSWIWLGLAANLLFAAWNLRVAFDNERIASTNSRQARVNEDLTGVTREQLAQSLEGAYAARDMRKVRAMLDRCGTPAGGPQK
jgi:hypothetical protein